MFRGRQVAVRISYRKLESRNSGENVRVKTRHPQRGIVVIGEVLGVGGGGGGGSCARERRIPAHQHVALGFAASGRASRATRYAARLARLVRVVVSVGVVVVAGFVPVDPPALTTGTITGAAGVPAKFGALRGVLLIARFLAVHVVGERGSDNGQQRQHYDRDLVVGQTFGERTRRRHERVLAGGDH